MFISLGFFSMKIKNLYPGISLIEKKFNKNQIYYFLKTPDISTIIAKIKNKYLVVSQKRIPVDKITYEFPGGLIDKGSTPKKTATTELLEETGYKSIDNPKKLLTIYPDPGRLDCKYYYYFTNKIKKISYPEKGINLHLLSKTEILKLIKKNKFSHACHAYAFLSYLNKS